MSVTCFEDSQDRPPQPQVFIDLDRAFANNEPLVSLSFQIAAQHLSQAEEHLDAFNLEAAETQQGLEKQIKHIQGFLQILERRIVETPPRLSEALGVLRDHRDHMVNEIQEAREVIQALEVERRHIAEKVEEAKNTLGREVKFVEAEFMTLKQFNDPRAQWETWIDVSQSSASTTGATRVERATWCMGSS